MFIFGIDWIASHSFEMAEYFQAFTKSYAKKSQFCPHISKMSHYQPIGESDRKVRNGDVEMGAIKSPATIPRTKSGYIVTNCNSPVHYQAINSDANVHLRSSKSNREYKSVPRLLDRKRGMHQSTGRLYVKKRIQQEQWWALYGYDWFHSLVDAPTSRIIAILLVTYVGIVAFFGAIYYWIRITYYCEMNFDTYLGAFDLSLEVMATFGFSTIIDQCILSSMAVLAQSCLRLIVESVTIGVLYSRFARPSSRASTVLFSNRAVIRRIRGKLYFMFQLCELRKHQLVEAHIRLYAVKRENDGFIDELDHVKDKNSKRNQKLLPKHAIPLSETFVQTCSMRLNHPNDELGSMLLLMMPQVVVHEIDSMSPLMPPPMWSTNHTKRKVSSSNGSYQSNSQKREIIRWNPPVYRRFVRMTTDGSSEEHREFDVDGPTNSNPQSISQYMRWEYDAEVLSNLAYPNVYRRDADLDNSTSNQQNQTLSHHNTPFQSQIQSRVPTSSSSSQLLNTPTAKPTHKSSTTFYHQHLSNNNSDKSNSTNQNSSFSLWHTATANTPIPLTSPRPPFPYTSHLSDQNNNNISSNTLLSSKTIFQQQLLSPGMEKYEGHLHHMSTLDASGVAAGLRQRKPNHEQHISTFPVSGNILSEGKDDGNSNPSSKGARKVLSLQQNVLSSDSRVLQKDAKSELTKLSHSDDDGDEKDEAEDFYGLLSSYQGNTRHSSQDTGSGDESVSQKKLFSRDLYRTINENDECNPPTNGETVAYEDTNGSEEEDDDTTMEPLWQREEREMIQRYLQDRQVEIIAVVEGVDATTGGNVQARHSYIASEIAWHKNFAYCMYDDPDDGLPTVDFALFHELVPVSTDAAFCGPLSSAV